MAITGNFASDEDVLAFTDTANITGEYDSSTGILTLSGNDTLANYQAALRSVTFQDTSDDPSQLARTIAFSYSDTSATSDTGLDTVAVTAVNLPPTITMPVSSQTIGENTSFSLSGANAITVGDIDANGVPDQLTLSASHGTLTLGSTTGLTGLTGNGTSTVVSDGIDRQFERSPEWSDLHGEHRFCRVRQPPRKSLQQRAHGDRRAADDQRDLQRHRAGAGSHGHGGHLARLHRGKQPGSDRFRADGE